MKKQHGRKRDEHHVFCSQFCSQPEGILEAKWARYEYMESENLELNSIAV
jgi:hypothetical protein